MRTIDIADSLPFMVEVVNVPEDINAVLESVGRTQTGISTVPPVPDVVRSDNVEEPLPYMTSVSL